MADRSSGLTSSQESQHPASSAMAKRHDDFSLFEWSERGFLARLRKERNRSTFTVADIAQHLNLTRSAYLAIEAGRSPITLDVIVSLPGLLFDMQYLFTGERSSNLDDALMAGMSDASRAELKAMLQ